ncbi:MAG: TolC family protein [Bacteroidetes bacterium]|nr:TolC family protein [Bacteroidota bacterium]MDA0943377.1 TolC family protein [Bacteroidota bacterium]MDA1111009.1 TolC family protein [Bacteroidota bacterium]
MNNKIFSFLALCGLTGLGMAQSSFSLDEAIAYGKSHNTAYMNAGHDVAIAQETVNQTLAMGLPQISASGNYQQYLTVPGSWIKNSFSTQPGAPEYIFLQFQQAYTSSANLSVNQLIFDGTYFVGLKASKEFVNLSQLQENLSEQSLKSSITKAYILVASLQKNQEFIQANKANINQSLLEMRALNKEGFTETLDVQRLELNYRNIVLQEEKLNMGIAMALNALKLQMGYPMNDELNISLNLEQLNSSMSSIDAELNNFNPSTRLEYQLLNQSILLNEMDKKRYQMGYIPQLVGFYQHQETTQRPEFNFFQSNLTPNNNWVPSNAIGLSMRLTLFDGLKTPAKLREIDHKIEKGQNDLSQFQNAAWLQYQNAKRSYELNLTQAEIQKESLDLAQDIYNKSLLKLKEGVGSSLEVTQAETELKAAQNNYLNAIYDLVLSKVDLKTAYGSL